eukprot:gene14195-21762_t
MSLAMYTLLKNGALFLTAMGDVYFFDRQLTSDHLLSFYFMLIGSVLSVGDDRWITATGLFWTVANVLLTAGYNLSLKRTLSENKVLGGHWAVMFFNNAMSVPLLLPLALSGWGSFMEDATKLPVLGTISLGFFVFAGAVLSVTSLWCLHVTSPTTFTVVGASCKIPNIVLGAIIFSQYPTKRGVLGIIVAFLGVF